MIRTRELDPQRDFISELNLIAAREVDRGGPITYQPVTPHHYQSTANPLSGDEYPITYDPDGYPLLPECLKR
jgi:hypothetical protein